MGESDRHSWLKARFPLFFLLILCLGVLPRSVTAQTPTPSPSPSPPSLSSGTGQSVAEPSGTGQSVADFTNDFWYIFVLVLMVGVFWSVLLIYDLFKSYQERRRNWYPLMKAMVDKLGQGKDGLTTEELKSVAGILVQFPSGTKGLARQAIALTVATIISIILVLLLLIGVDSDRELVKTIVTALVASFTTIVGFYFGARTAEGGVETAAAAAAVAPSPSQPSGTKPSGTKPSGTKPSGTKPSDLNEKPLQPGTELSDADPEYMEEGEDFDTQWAEGDTPESGGKV